MKEYKLFKISRNQMAVVGMLLCMALYSCGTLPQGGKPDTVEITLPESISGRTMEFSSMAWEQNRLLLVPQYPERHRNALFAINRKDVHAAVFSNKALTTFEEIRIVHLDAIKKQIGPTYEGIEATAIVGKKIFFTFETNSKDADCYLAGGTIDGSVITLNAEKIMRLPKLKRLSNAGYESMAYIKKLNRLIVFFEYNKADVGSKAWLIDTSLTLSPKGMAMDPLMYRLTDVTAVGDKLLGTNSFFNGSKIETPEYIGADSTYMEPELNGKTLYQSSFNRIVELSVGDKISWKAKRTIGLKNENWEGIAPFKNGVLIVTDEHPRTILKWMQLR